jgi:hypothetical protein
MNRIYIVAAVLLGAATANAATVRLESRWLSVEVDRTTGAWALTDARSGVRWPATGMASAGTGQDPSGEFAEAEEVQEGKAVVLRTKNGAEVAFRLSNDGRSLEICHGGEHVGDVSVLGDALALTDTEKGYLVVPCREGLLIPADSGTSFTRTFGTSDYEGCHMNMLGFAKNGSALIVDWDDAYTFPEVKSVRPENGPVRQRLTTTFHLRRTARSVRLTPLGRGDWNTIATGYRLIAEQKGLAVTLRQKTARNPHLAELIGASNVKLWTCLARRMTEDSKKEESVNVRWTFDEAARIAEHLKKDVGLDRALFMMGGWTEGGYDCRHPDNLPANPECDGNDGLADAIRRIQELGYVGCLHDNVQDMYADAKSFDLSFIEKDAAGNPQKGGRWLGGRAWMVCAPKQLELAMRPQNLPEICRLFGPWSYFIDTTFAVGPRECSDPAHPLDRNGDIAWKQKLSDYARDTFGLFGSECGREWALPHSDFFEGLVAVSGRYYRNLDPASLGATVIPFWEMVYHDCQIAYGKYGYAADQAAECVAHHALCARPLYYHSIPDHLYWTQQTAAPQAKVMVRPRVVEVKPTDKQTFQIRYAWDVEADVKDDWRIFVHFGSDNKILFQNDQTAVPPTSQWRAGQTIMFGPETVTVPSSVQDKAVDVYIGLFSLNNAAARAPLVGGDRQNRILAGRLVLMPEIRFEPAAATGDEPARDAFVRSDGWAEGLHPTDVFIKNTHELLGPLHSATAHERLTRLEFLTADRTVRRAVYGSAADAVMVVANFGHTDATVETRLGGAVVLPPWGVVVESPRFAAFYARHWSGNDYPDGALFTLQSLDDEPLASSRRVRVFHGFGPATLAWRERTWTIAREQTIAP